MKLTKDFTYDELQAEVDNLNENLKIQTGIKKKLTLIKSIQKLKIAADMLNNCSSVIQSHYCELHESTINNEDKKKQDLSYEESIQYDKGFRFGIEVVMRSLRCEKEGTKNKEYIKSIDSIKDAILSEIEYMELGG